MKKALKQKQNKPIAKTGRSSKLTVGGKKMSDAGGYTNGLKFGPKGTYIYRIKVAGKVRTGDTAQTRLFEAENELVKIRANFLQDSMGIQKKKAPTFKAAIDIWYKKKSGVATEDYLNNLKRQMEVHFIPYIGHKYIDRLSKGDIEECLTRYAQKTQKGKPIKNFGGYNKLILMIGGIFTCMIEDKYLSSFQLPEQKKSQEINYDVLSNDELPTLFEECEKKYGLPRTVGIAMGCFLGLRASEIINAEWVFINWDKATFTNLKTKAKEAKSIPICEEMMDLLKRLKGDENRIGYIVLDPNGKKYGRKFAEHVLRQLGKAHFKMHLTAHSLRRSFITILHNGGTPPKTLQLLARHASLAQTMAYVKVGEPEKQAAINSVFKKRQA